MMNFREAVEVCLTHKRLTLFGRASRSEYWFFMLFTVLVAAFVLFFLGTWQIKPLLAYVFDVPSDFYLLRFIGSVISITLFIPTICVTVRRFHDCDYSGWWYPAIVLTGGIIGSAAFNLPAEMPLLSMVALLFIVARKGSFGNNRYGLAPSRSTARPDFTASAPRLSKTRLWVGLRPRSVLIAVICMALAAGVDLTSGYLLHAAPRPGPDDDRQKVFLRDPGADRLWKTHDDAVWALAFALQVNVEPVQKHHKVTYIEGKKGGSATVLHTKTRFDPDPPIHATRTLKVLLSLPDFGNIPGQFEDHKTTALEISMSSAQRTYNDNRDWGGPPSFALEFEERTNFECRPDREIAPGILRLREPSATEAAQILQRYQGRGPRFETRKGCINKNASHGASYGVRDDAGAPLGFGTCTSYRAGATFGTCHFRFWLAQERIIDYRFSERFLPQLREIHAVARSLLQASTVAHASENVNRLTNGD